MRFDYEIFERQLLKAYNTLPHCAFTFEECRAVFNYYFQIYTECTGREHPPIKSEKLVEFLGNIELDGLLEPIDYRYIINRYFETPFRNCDRNICHFFSGRIRELRFYETLY